MSELIGIIVDLDLCTGCYACEVTCKQENNIPLGRRWIQVATIGPKRVGGKLQMDFIPVMTDECTLCEHRLNENLEPRCVENCPTGAFKFCKSETEMVIALQNGKRFQVCKLKGEISPFG